MSTIIGIAGAKANRPVNRMSAVPIVRAACCATLILLSPAVRAQNTGAAFPTPNGQTAPAAAVLVPCGSIVNGQPVMCPPGPLNGLAVTCVNCSPSAPTGASSNPVNGTIAVTNTFQVLLASNGSRKGCTFQNQGTHTMYASLSSSPTLANSLQLAPGAFYFCAGPSNISIIDQISITGTAGDAFAGEWQ
jgi:hypothetical protein